MLLSCVADAKQALDGIILSDGNVAMHGLNARFHLDLSGEEHVDWLTYTKSVLLTMGVMVSPVYPKVSLASSRGKRYSHCRVMSYTSPIITNQYDRWYPEGKKVVPDDLTITPISLANWFMGDGSSSWYKAYWVYAKFATHGLNQASVNKLILKLYTVGINHLTLDKNKSGTGITIGNITDVHKLMDMIEPHILPSYHYKIKRPRKENPTTGIYCKENKL